MTRGEEADQPVAAGDHLTSRETPGPTARFTVVVSADGSAVIDGERIPVAEGETVEAAVLGVLDGHARERGAPVTAAISTPWAEGVAVVEVFPEG